MIIRPATTAELDALAAVHEAAFSATAIGHQGEAQLVRQIEADRDALVSLVAEADGDILGHALFSRVTVDADGQRLRGAGLAPVAVQPSLQSNGIGSSLIRRGLATLTDMNLQICFVLGHPDYYPRFGFRADLARPFASPYAGPHFMALFLDNSLRLPESGRADYAPAFSR